MNDHKRLGYAIEQAAAELPDGWDILISIERHAGTVLLRDPSGDDIDCGHYEAESLAEDIENAVAHARCVASHK